MLECPDGRQPTALVGFGVISLKEGCTITSREFHYPHTFRGIVEISISSGGFSKEVISDPPIGRLIRDKSPTRLNLQFFFDDVYRMSLGDMYPTF